MERSIPRFPLGRIVGTPGALQFIEDAGQSASDYIRRHVSGDWGDVDFADAAANELAIRDDLRILSVYKLANGTIIWIITEADRSSTCVLLPSEY